MPVTLTEKLDSRKWTTGDNASVEFVYILTGTSDDVNRSSREIRSIRVASQHPFPLLSSIDKRARVRRSRTRHPLSCNANQVPERV